VYADCIQTAGVRTTTNIYNNTLYNFGENALDLKHARYIDVYNNEMYHGNSNFLANGGGYWGPSIIGAGLSSSWTSASAAMDNTIRYNYMHSCKYTGFGGIGDNAKVYGNYFKNIGLAVVAGSYDNTEIYNNVFELTEPVAYETTYPGTAYEFDWSTRYVGTALSGIRVMYSPKTNAKIYNNTFYISSSNHLYGIAVQADADATGTIIKNNIIHMTSNNSGVFPLYIEDYDNSGTLLTVQYNELYGVHSNRVRIEETPGNWTTYDSTEQADWRTAGHTGGLFTDPLLVNPSAGDLTLQSSSPAIDAGVDLGIDYDDALDPDSTWPDSVAVLDQDLYGAGWEIGSYVFDMHISAASPAQNAVGISVTVDLTWTNPTGTTNIDLLFDKKSEHDPPTTVRLNDQDQETWDCGTLDYNTEYAWRVDINHAGGTETGTVYYFTTTTQANPPVLSGGGAKWNKDGVAWKWNRNGVSIK